MTLWIIYLAVNAYGTALATITYSEYDKANRLVKSYTADVLYATNYEYNKLGQQTKVTDAESHFTQYAYDKGGRLTRVTNAKGNYTDFTYDKDSQRTKVTYYKNSTPIDTTYTYYKNHLLKSVTYPGFAGTNTTNYTYDGNGNMTQKTDAKSQTITYTYDKNNRLTLKTYPDSSTVTYTYDAKSNVLTLIDANTDTTNEYDDLSRLTKVTDKKYSPNKIIQYTYYEDGLRKSMTDPESNLIEYTYDKAKRLATVKRNSTTESTYEYNALGLRTKLTYGNNAYAEYEYNHSLRWLTALRNKKSTAEIISSFAYTHDNVGNRKTMTLANGDAITYTYDEIYQLTSEVRTGASAYNISWTYDEVGNRLTQIKDGGLTTYTYNNANQLLNETTGGVVTNYEYDANGSQIKKTKGTDIWQWAYDYENRQISYDDPVNANDANYLYDAEGKRIQKHVGGIDTKFIYDGANVVADYNASNILQAIYITPFLDQNLLTIKNSNVYYYLQDGLGSVRNIMDAGQTAQNSYDYYAFGEVLSETENVVNRYKFTSREWDGESGQYYYRARYYLPKVGRFLQRDPIDYEDGISLYTYVQNNPPNLIDPQGLQELPKAIPLGHFSVSMAYGVKKERYSDYLIISTTINYEPPEKCCCDIIDFIQIVRIKQNGKEYYISHGLFRDIGKELKERAIGIAKPPYYCKYLKQIEKEYRGYTVDVRHRQNEPYYINKGLTPGKGEWFRGWHSNAENWNWTGRCNAKGVIKPRLGDILEIEILEDGRVEVLAETCAVCVKGTGKDNDEGKIYGCTRWWVTRGWTGKFYPYPGPKDENVRGATLPSGGIFLALWLFSRQTGWRGFEKIEKAYKEPWH